MTTLKTFVLTLATILCAIGGVMPVEPIHRAIFALVPPALAMEGSNRVALDGQISQYLVTEDRALIATLAPKEQRHLKEVRVVWQTAVLAGTILALVGAALPGRVQTKLAIGLIALVGLVSLLSFQPSFVVLHKVLFSNTDWLLPFDEYTLTRIYPLGFFVGAWMIVLAMASGVLVGIRAVTGGSEVAK